MTARTTPTGESGPFTWSLENLTDAEIRDRFPNQPSWLEAIVVAEARADWLGRGTVTDFLMANPNQTLNQVATRLGTAARRGRTGHTIHEPILGWKVGDY